MTKRRRRYLRLLRARIHPYLDTLSPKKVMPKLALWAIKRNLESLDSSTLPASKTVNPRLLNKAVAFFYLP